jgi:hypothetical protein
MIQTLFANNDAVSQVDTLMNRFTKPELFSHGLKTMKVTLDTYLFQPAQSAGLNITEPLLSCTVSRSEHH